MLERPSVADRTSVASALTWMLAERSSIQTRDAEDKERHLYSSSVCAATAGLSLLGSL